MKFRKKPVFIEAIKYQSELGNNRVMNWLAHQGAEIAGWLFHDGEITIPTLEGMMKASDGDWIIRGVKGEFHPCKPDIFAATYEKATGEDLGEALEQVRREAIADAARLIKRGLKAIARKEWEEGQTLESWTHEAEDWLAVYRLEKQIAAKLRKETK